MTNYKELADRLSAFINDESFLDAVDEAAEILRSLEVRPLYAAPVAAQPQQASKPLSEEQWQEIAAITGCLRIEKRGRDAILRVLQEAAHGIKERG